MSNELVYKGNMLFSFKSLIKGHLVIIICITTIPSCSNNKLGVSCRCLIVTLPAVEMILLRYMPTNGNAQRKMTTGKCLTMTTEGFVDSFHLFQHKMFHGIFQKRAY